MSAKLSSEQAVLGILDAWRRLNLDEAVSFLSEDAKFLPDPKGKPVEGRDAICVLWTRYMGLFASYGYEVLNLLSSEGLVFVERAERVVRKDGQILDFPVAAVFELNSAGQITAWRDYWDPSMAGPAQG